MFASHKCSWKSKYSSLLSNHPHQKKTGQTGLATNLKEGHVEIQIYEKGKGKSLLSFPKTTMSMQNLDIKRCGEA